jgi:hypothetical protein
MPGSDATVYARLQLAEDLARIEQAKQDLEIMLKQLDDVDARTAKPHLCHVCETKTRNKE